MKWLVLMVVLTAVALPLALASPAPAMRVSGSALSVGATDPEAKAATELAAYIAAVQPVYTELTDCACCCETLDLPPRRCAACTTVAAKIKGIVARIHRVQAKMTRLEVPLSLIPTHGRLVTAISTMHVSGQYMATTVRTAPGALVIARRVRSTSARGPVVWEPSPGIVSAARLAALADARPPGIARGPFLKHRYSETVSATVRPEGAPGEQAMAYLGMWRDDLAAQAKDAGLSLPTALAG
jgi:hypothetical protein